MFSGLIRIKLEMIVQISGRKETCSLAILINNVINSDTRLDLTSGTIKKHTTTEIKQHRSDQQRRSTGQRTDVFAVVFAVCFYFKLPLVRLFVVQFWVVQGSLNPKH